MNKISLTILFLFFFSKFSTSQNINGVILDSKSKKGIPFANITYKNKRIGASSNINGTFLLKKIPTEDTLIFSAIGYEKKRIHIEVFKKNTSIQLKRKTIKLNEIKIKKKKYKNHTIKNTKGDLKGLFITMRGDQLVTHIENKKSKEGYLKNITLFLKNKKGLKNVDLRLRIYKYNTIRNIPGDDILYENLIFERKGNKTKIDLTKHNIFFPKEGLCVGIEWLDSKNKTNGERILIGPAACINYSKKNTIKTWSSYRGRNWDNPKGALIYGEKIANLKIIAEILI